MKTKILALLCIPFILSACSSPEKPESPIPMMMINIKGIVTDFNTNKPIEGAQITAYTFEWGVTYKEICTAKTNQDGYYSIHQSHKCMHKLGAIKAEKKDIKQFTIRRAIIVLIAQKIFRK